MAAASSQLTPPGNADGASSITECPVCCEVFQTPKSLSCGHSVCAECCQKLLQPINNSISCPVCRQSTTAPPSGLPTNFALQDVIEHYRNRDAQKRYQCTECGRQCTADEAWISGLRRVRLERADAEVAVAPRCFRCLIVKHAGGVTSATTESVTDAFKRHDNYLAILKKRMETVSNEQREWTDDMQQATQIMKGRVDEIVREWKVLTKRILEDVEKLNNEFRLLGVHADSFNVPQSLEGLVPFEQSIQDMAWILGHLPVSRLRTKKRADAILNSLTVGLDCLLDVGDIQKEIDEAVVEELGLKFDCLTCQKEGHKIADCPIIPCCLGCGSQFHVIGDCRHQSGGVGSNDSVAGHEAASGFGLSDGVRAEAGDRNVQGGSEVESGNNGFRDGLNDSAGPAAILTCYRCGEEGHFSRECPRNANRVGRQLDEETGFNGGLYFGVDVDAAIDQARRDREDDSGSGTPSGNRTEAGGRNIQGGGVVGVTGARPHGLGRGRGRISIL